MNALIPEDLGPLAVWDTGDCDGFWHEGGTVCQLGDAVQWAHNHIPEAFRTYRVEFYLIDAPFAVIRRFALNADGRTYTDPETGEIAVEPPVVVPLTGLPPAHLLRLQ